ncbi:MAG: hypothetical protein GC149_15035 [Gammaproteobacteria bacterium]|nr:hypothetical protein [Gammaproteobacteria bacterium]
MPLIAANEISEPRLKVSPPAAVFALVWIIFVAILFVFLMAPDSFVKYSLVAVWGLVLLAVLRKQLMGNYLVTLQANRDGLYFQTSKANQYFHAPWKNVGQIEKTLFPLNSKGLRVEITGDLVESIKHAEDAGNVGTEGGRTFIYTIPQLNNRDKLIKRLESFRN